MDSGLCDEGNRKDQNWVAAHDDTDKDASTLGIRSPANEHDQINLLSKRAAPRKSTQIGLRRQNPRQRWAVLRHKRTNEALVEMLREAFMRGEKIAEPGLDLERRVNALGLDQKRKTSRIWTTKRRFLHRCAPINIRDFKQLYLAGIIWYKNEKLWQETSKNKALYLQDLLNKYNAVSTATKAQMTGVPENHPELIAVKLDEDFTNPGSSL